ncbi:MAG: sensor histidine kinase [Chloroflexi bacterium]|nr:sensor histidine kinase [Chloroflexota bacterium]
MKLVFQTLTAYGLLAGGQVGSCGESVDANSLSLTNAAQIRSLTKSQASRHLPVQLQGVVVLKGPGSVVLEDSTAGIYSEEGNGILSRFQSGDWLSVTGMTDPGTFGPFVKISKATKTGTGAIPSPKLVTFSDLQTARFDAQWVEVSGVVRRSEPSTDETDVWKLWIAAAGGQLPVRLSVEQGSPLAVDSEIRLRGVCFYQVNKAGQAVKPLLEIPRDQPVVVTRPAPEEPFAIVERPIRSLMQFSAEDWFSHRVRVSGVVTYAVLGEGFWIQSGNEGLRVRNRQNESLTVGDRVEVLGFLGWGEGYSPVLEDAVFRQQGKAKRPLPIGLTDSRQALGYDEALVQLEAQILEQWLALDGCRLTLKDERGRFPALLRLNAGATAPKNWLPGSHVRVVGICRVTPIARDANSPGAFEPGSFQILLRSPEDITILRPPPWWTSEHIAWMLGIGLSVAALVVVAVLWLARHRLRQQAISRMKSEAEFAAVFNERNRMAREIHDTLAQGLSAISVQLEAVKRQLPSDAKAREPLEVARGLARANLAEARNAIWNVRSQVLETADLGTALNDILRNLTEGCGTKGGLRVRGQMRRLAPVTENNLLRIGQEAITNAAKYAQARNILVALDFEERQFRMSVSDDGKGFTVESPPASEGGFGLKGMRERAAQWHAEFSVTSEPGEGTIVMLFSLFRLHRLTFLWLNNVLPQWGQAGQILSERGCQ